ncbi:hypothetical protein H5410_003728 [Solanum commersonii]|uniref:Uncharacterized protein n=1 Tax=Solanum commersonii TaxID=4109 RepID=A0A9J6B5W9_SOLCO|nr:hypothetical protein H5410_003728 [Solanum commersonii]
MLPSHVSGRFLLRKCSNFDLSKYDDVVFVDENEERFPTKYLTGKNLLSRGLERVFQFSIFFKEIPWTSNYLALQILGNTLNEDILNKVGVFLVVEKMRILRLGWFRFVKRRSNANNTITKESMLLFFTY